MTPIERANIQSAYSLFPCRSDHNCWSYLDKDILCDTLILLQEDNNELFFILWIIYFLNKRKEEKLYNKRCVSSSSTIRRCGCPMCGNVTTSSTKKLVAKKATKNRRIYTSMPTVSSMPTTSSMPTSMAVHVSNATTKVSMFKCCHYRSIRSSLLLLPSWLPATTTTLCGCGSRVPSQPLSIVGEATSEEAKVAVRDL